MALCIPFGTTSWVILCFALLGFVQQPSTSVLDTWILKRCQNPNQMYGPIRSTGSFAFALFTGVYGGILNSRGYGIMPAVAGIF
ncbi:MAG: MFS transporter [Clostridia bacterium]